MKAASSPLPDLIVLSPVVEAPEVSDSPPKPPRITLKNYLFIPLHIMYDKMAPDEPTNAPVTIKRLFPRVKPMPQAAHPE